MSGNKLHRILAVLGFVLMNEFNKVRLGYPHLKPEVRMLFALDHTFTTGRS